MGARTLKESRLVQITLTWSYRQKKTSYSTLKVKSYSTSEIGSAVDTRDACANYSSAATNAWDTHIDSPTSIINDNADCLNPR
jgi:hypothetical protein